jgi:glutaminyl-peptide cyclotransferase
MQMLRCSLSSALTVICCIGCTAPEAERGPDAAAMSARFNTRTNADATLPPIPYDAATPRITLRAIASTAHDSSAFTQGFLFHGGRLYEGTGLAGQSELRVVDRTTGIVRQRTSLTAPLFGEGIAVIGTRVFQLTWQGGRGIVYDIDAFAPIDSFTYTGEGWGLTSDGRRLYLSDGSDRIRVLDATSFAVVRSFKVTEADSAVWMLNELEWVDGELLANVYQTDLIARIDPASRRVIGWLDTSELLPRAQRDALRERGGVANGIAYDSIARRLLVTGKRWPRVYEVAVPPRVAH